MAVLFCTECRWGRMWPHPEADDREDLRGWLKCIICGFCEKEEQLLVVKGMEKSNGGNISKS